ncbi:MAG: FGGY family carbohydrate kinase, partial [Gammaproteobacteria bacterium]
DRQRHDHQAEQDAQQIAQSVLTAVGELFARLPQRVRYAISYCGLATQRSTVLSWNTNGDPISPALNWQDTRGDKQLENLLKHSYEIKQISGLPLSSHYGASKLYWLMQNCKGEQDQIFGPLSSFLLSRIGNKLSNTVDHGNAQRMQLLDIETGEWSQRLLDLFGLPITSLPECRPIYHDYGQLRGYGIPITAINGDQNAAWFGQGATTVGTAMVNIGSGAFVLTAQQSETNVPELLSTIAYSDNTCRSYLLEATVNGAGNALNWLCSNRGIVEYESHLQSILEQIVNPPIFLNTVGGLGSPWWKSDLPPIFVNSAEHYSTDAMIAGVCESILFLIYRNIQEMQKVQTVSELQLCGGLSRVDMLCQKLANLSNLPIKRMNDAESTIRGIAWIASGQPQGWDIANYDRFYPETDTYLRSRFELFIEQLGEYLENSTDE